MPIPESVNDLVPLLDLEEGLERTDGGSNNKTNTSQDETNLEKFFEAVKEGKIEDVKIMLKNNPENTKAENSDGDTALEIAINNNNSDMVNELLFPKEANDEFALFRSIYDNDLASFKAFPKVVIQRLNERSITPTIVAAELGRKEILKILIEKGHVVKEPPAFGLEPEEELSNEILRPRTTLNSFSALTTPMYICLTFLHEKKTNTIKEPIWTPLTKAFELNEKVRQRAEDEPALKTEYLALSKRCTTFATDLCNCCNTVEESNALFHLGKNDLDEGLSEDSKDNVLKILRKAIHCKHKEFVAHRYTEELLDAMVYPSSLPKLLTKYTLFKALAFTLYTIMFPLLAIIHNVEKFACCDDGKLSKVMTTPFGKFISHISQFLVFFILIAASALRNSHRPSGLEIFIFITVFGMIVQEFMVFRRHKPRDTSYFSKWWNVITAIMLLLFVLSALTWIVGYGITGGWTVGELSITFYKGKDGYYFLLLGNTFFSLGIVASVFHLVDLFQVSSVLGPLQLSLYRMILDVLKFFLFFGAIFVAFVMGQLKLYSYYNSIQVELAAYGHSNFSTDADTNEHFSTLSQSTRSMFWALFDKVDLEDFDTKDKLFAITEETGKLLFAFYSVCAVMVALNMLIAMMTTSYDKITQYDVEWKFVRAKLWLEFADRGALPAPYNLLPIRAIYEFFKKKFRKEKSRDTKIKLEESQEKMAKTIKRLIHRYLRNQESQRSMHGTTR